MKTYLRGTEIGRGLTGRFLIAQLVVMMAFAPVCLAVSASPEEISIFYFEFCTAHVN